VSGALLAATNTGPTELMDGMLHNYLVDISETDARIEISYQGCTVSIPCGTMSPPVNGKIVFNYDLSCPPGPCPQLGVCGVIRVNGQDTQGVTLRFFDCVTGALLVTTTTGPTTITAGVAHNYMVDIPGPDARLEVEFDGCAASVPCGTMPAPVDCKITFNYDLSCPEGPGTATPGYWKNHPEAWPVSSIDIGGVTYSEAQAIALMSTPERGDKSLNVFRHLVSAKLNVLNGTDDSCIADDINVADAWMALHPPRSKVSGKSAAWREISAIAAKLDDYNNGRLCAPHRD